VRITVRLFSRLRDVAGTGVLTLELPPGSRVGDAVAAIQARYPALTPYDGSTLVACNEEWTKRDAILSEGDELALMPPVSGG